MDLNKSKRLFLKLACSSFAIFAIYKLKYFEEPLRILSHAFDKPLTDLSNEDFYLLSLDLLGETSKTISPDLSNRIWSQMQNIPELKEKLFLMISDHKRKRLNQEPLAVSEEFTEIHSEALKTTLRFWYTGVLKYKKNNAQRFFYEEALMHSQFSHLRPPPANCGGTFGYWSKPPENS